MPTVSLSMGIYYLFTYYMPGTVYVLYMHECEKPSRNL